MTSPKCERCGEEITSGQSRVMDCFLAVANEWSWYPARVHRTCRDDDVRTAIHEGFEPMDSTGTPNKESEVKDGK